MPLTRDDHKRISLTVADELRRVLALHQGAKLMARHRARLAAPPEETPDETSEADAEAMAEMMAESSEDGDGNETEAEAEPPREEKDPGELDAVKKKRHPFGKRR